MIETFTVTSFEYSSFNLPEYHERKKNHGGTTGHRNTVKCGPRNTQQLILTCDFQPVHRDDLLGPKGLLSSAIPRIGGYRN